MNRFALITIADGRHEHLLRQREAVAQSTLPPAHHVVVAMGDPAIAELLHGHDDVVPVDMTVGTEDGLPLARARNLGAATALALGASTLVFLDVDCLPAPDALRAYAEGAEHEATRDRILCGPVTYLPPPPRGGYRLSDLAEFDRPHPARPAPVPGEVQLGGEHALFWSLSFAVTARTWLRTGGFHEQYTGYGGEDTDFAFAARSAGVELAWIGSARAYHQHHAVQNPPVSHLDDIVRNANLFHERWGEWPMRGWLDAFEQRGLVRVEAGRYTTIPGR